MHLLILHGSLLTLLTARFPPESLSEALRQLGKQGVYLSFTLDLFSHTVYIPWTFCLCEATLVPFCVIEWMRFPLFFFPFSSGNS